MRRSIVWGMVWLGLAAGPTMERLGRLEEPAILEASGIVRSRKHPGIFWVHNDSGNPPVLFAVKRDGQLIRSYRVEVPNVDWEDIATDDEGHLYLGDIGNNDNRLPIRAIHRIDEPDPAMPMDEPLKATASTYYRFPEGIRFDAEGLFVAEGRAFVVTKRRDGGEAKVFAIRFDPPGSLLRPTLPEHVATLPGCVEPATGADLSPDGRLLAVVTTKTVHVYEPDRSGWAIVSTVQYHAPDVEAICWDGPDLILASEDRSIYRIAEEVWKKSKGDGR